MDIASISQIAGEVEMGTEKERATLKAACEQFEGMLLGMVLKDGLKSGVLDEEGDHSAAVMQDFAVEQMARSLSAGGRVGIADMLYRQMTMQ